MPAPRKKTAAITEIEHELCWAKTLRDGKPGISVRDHCLNVGCVAEALLELLASGLRELLPQSAATLAALHDIGKVSPGFQQKCQLWLSDHELAERALAEGWGVLESDHAKISQFTVQALLGQSRLHPWAAILGAHHGRIKGESVSPCEPFWKQERHRLLDELVGEFGRLPDSRPAEAALWLLAGIITVADWIGSDERCFNAEANLNMAERRECAARALQQIRWTQAEVTTGLGFKDLFPRTPKANSLQTSITKAVKGPGLYIVEGPMGSGKTEAALQAAYQLIQTGVATGLYFALPTQTTSNRIHLRLQPFVQRICDDPVPVRLAHSASWLVDSEHLSLDPGGHDAAYREHMRAGRMWFASPKRALLMPFGVGTIDQALLGIVAAKHFFVRQFALSGKVVVLDEIHTYDLYTSTLVDTLIRRLRELHCTVIILSATLTEQRRRELLQLANDVRLSEAYPLISGKDGQLKEWPCDKEAARTACVRRVSGDSLADEVLERAQRGECVLWIRNTVEDAQLTYRALMSSSIEGGPRIGLLHSRFPFFRREQLETEWMAKLGKDETSRPIGCVLVSTQVAEQSVDIDADMLVTDLAPTDMLLQRLGRLWRHERPTRPCSQPEMWIQMPPLSSEDFRSAGVREIRESLGKSGKVYAPYVLLRSMEQWRARPTIILPDDIRPILEATYCDSSAKEPAAWQQLRQQLELEKQKMSDLALNATMIWTNPALGDEEGVQTRYGTYPTIQLLLLKEVTDLDAASAQLRLLDGSTVVANGRDWSFDAAKAIFRNLARVPRWVASGIPEKPQGWIRNYVDQPTILGLIHGDDSIRAVDGETDLAISYHAEQGVVIHTNSARRA